MPDAFGNETPQEAIERVRSGFRDANARFQDSAAFASPGAQAGQALANIFGGTIRKSLETRGARSAEEDRLIAAGMSPGEARETAKKTVTRDFNVVRKAKRMERATQGAQELIERLTQTVGADMARASGMRLAAIELRKQGFATEATKLTIQADEIVKAERERREGLLDAKSVRSKREADRIKVVQETEEGAGLAPLQKQQLNRESLEAQLDEEADLDKRTRIQRDLDDVNQLIEKIKLRTGRTAEDLEAEGFTTPTKTALEKSINASDNQLDLLGSIGRTYQPEFLTIFGRAQAWTVAKLEKVGVTVGPEMKAFLTSYSTFKRNSLDGLNRYIKLITGAQMSEAEADRLRKAFPDVEQDSPTEFVAKYIATVQQIMAVRNRARASLKAGTFDLLPEDMKGGEGASLDAYMPSFEAATALSGLAQFARDVEGGADKPPATIVVGEPVLVQ